MRSSLKVLAELNTVAVVLVGALLFSAIPLLSSDFISEAQRDLLIYRGTLMISAISGAILVAYATVGLFAFVRFLGKLTFSKSRDFTPAEASVHEFER